MRSGNQIKKELAEKLNVKSSCFSVRVEYSSINIEIKCPKIELEEVEKIVNKYESVSRCEYSGEILSGGNTFVFVDYSWDLRKEMYNSEEFEKQVINLVKNNYSSDGWRIHQITKSLMQSYLSPYNMAPSMMKIVLGNILNKNYRELNLSL